MKYWAFATYSVLYEAIIWGVFGYAVFVEGHSGWWLVLATFLSLAQLPSKRFGIKEQYDIELPN